MAPHDGGKDKVAGMSSWLGLRSRLVLLGLIALVPVFALFACSAAKNEKTAVALAHASLQSQALLAAANHQRLFDRVAQLLGDMASGPSIKDTRNRLCVQYLQNLQAQDAGYSNLGVVGLDGKISCHARDSGNSIDLGDRTFFKKVMAGQKIAVGDFEVSRSSGRPGIAFGVPVMSREGIFNGVAFAAVDIAEVARTLAESEVLEGAQLRLIDRRGTILAIHPAILGVQGAQEQDTVVRDAARARLTGVREAMDPAGLARVYAFAPLGGPAGDGLFVAISVPRDLIMAGPRAFLGRELLALLAMSAFGVACAWWLGRRLIVNPARAILKEANEVGQGNLGARVKIGPLFQGELGEIGRSFNRMAESLQARQNERDAALRDAHEERAMIDLILNSMSEGVIAVDAASRVLLFNTEAHRLFNAPEIGASIEDCRRDNDLLTLDGATLERADGPLMQALRGARTDNRQLLLRRAGAPDRVLSISARPLFDADRQRVGGVTVFSDITERKAAESFALAQEEALVSSEARFRELAENIEDVFYNIDAANGRVLYISPGYAQICGRSCESLYADPASYSASVVAEDQPLLKEAAQRNHAGERSDIEYRIVSTAGQTRWIRECAYPVFGAAGVLERVVGTARDITERKLADLALASTNRALQMLSRSSMAIKQIDDEARLLAEVCRVAVDAGNYRMAWVGYAQDDAVKSIEPMAHAGHESGYLASIEISWNEDHATGRGPAGEAIRSGQPQQRSDISRDKGFFWRDAAMQCGYRSCIGLPLRDAQRTFGVLCLYAGEVQQFTPGEVALMQELADNLAFGIGSLRARLARQQSDEAARQAVAKVSEQASLLDRAQDAIMVRNLDRTLRFWNKGAERLYGWTAEEVLGKSMEAFMYPNPQVLGAAVAQAVANNGDWNGELEQKSRDGACVYVESRVTILRDAQDQINGVLAINTDIRERKRAREEILQLNASLEERVQQRTAQLLFANQQLETFSYSVSHDLRSPLNTIAGFCGLLEKSLAQPAGAPLGERSRHYLARIRAGAAQMGELIEAMLTLAQVSRSLLRWEPVDLSALAQALASSYQEREPSRAVQFQIKAGVHAHGDPLLLKQVLDNLLGNAWKFSAGQACPEIVFGQETGSAGEMVNFVRDNGAGFDMAHAEKLFGPFQRLHTQAEFAGTGIGLATVQRIIVRHGGKIWGESAPGQGATFYFTLGREAM
jgi:PAS domain S-box-containing protein